MDLKIIYEDNNVLVVEKPAGLIVFPEGKTKEKTLADYLLKNFSWFKKSEAPPRYGIVHRLDKETSGILLVAKNKKVLLFLQKQFKNKRVEKKYKALVVGKIKNNEGKIKTLIGRSPKNRKKQKVFLRGEPGSEGKREAITKYRVIDRFNNFTLLEVLPQTGRKHQIRCHLAYIHHPIVGDKLYGFKNQPSFPELERQFLHASYIKIKLPTGEEKEFKSELPEDLKRILKKLKNDDHKT